MTAKKVRTIAVDLDGTLATQRKDGLIGDPIKKTADMVKRLHGKGVRVVIFTARMHDQVDALTRIKYWLETNGLPDLMVTNRKTPDIEEFWDNRAIRVEENTGVICSCCDKSRGQNSPSRLFTTDC